MRISTTQMFRTGIDTMNAQQSDLMHLFQQIGTGRRLVTPADDPLAASQTINLSQVESMNARYKVNRSAADQSLKMADTSLGSVVDSLVHVRTTIVQAGGVLSDVDRTSIANVLRVARDSLLTQANATDGNGQYLFSGFRGDTEPFSFDAATGAVTYNGDSGQRLVQVDQTRQLETAHIGTDIFNRASPGAQTYLTQADGGNTGTGLISTPQTTVPAAGQPNNNGMNFRIDFSAGTPVQYTVTVIDPETGAEFPGTPVDYTGEGVIDLGGVSVKMGGTPAAGDSFDVEHVQTRRADGSSVIDMFGVLDDVIKALESPVEGSPEAQTKLNNILASASQQLAVTYDNVLTVRAAGGARMFELDALNANGSMRDLNYKQQLSNMEDVDYRSATAQLSLRQAALEAATLAFRRIQSTSLFTIKGGST